MSIEAVDFFYLSMPKVEDIGELKHITAEVDPILEMSTITYMSGKQVGGPTLLFENVKGARHPLLLNLFGTMDRITLALGMSPAELGRFITQEQEQWGPFVRSIFAADKK